MPKARQVFEGLPVQDVVSWTALMAGYARVGEIGNVCQLFEHMLENGVKPDPITFVVVLGACARGGLVRSTRTYYELMSKDYGLTPSFQHNICIVDLFLRSGRADQALEMTRKMAVGWNSAAWNCMLRACRSWGNSEFARKVFALGEIAAI
jgi:pentatricopeptide repeat protein